MIIYTLVLYIVKNHYWILNLSLTAFFIFGAFNSFGQKVDYLHSPKTLQEITKIDSNNWLEYTSPYQIYNGVNNGIYWFRISCEKSNKNRIISINESHVTRATLYIGYRKYPPISNKRFVTFKVPKKQTVYLQVDCRLEARIPLIIQDEKTFVDSENNEFLLMGIYYGVVLSILLINLYSFFSFKDKTYLHYMLMVFGMAANAFYKDGMFAAYFGRYGLNETIEPLINSIVPLSAILFMQSYLRAKYYRPRLFLVSSSIIVLAQVLTVTVIITGVEMWLFTTTDVVLMVSIDLFWLTGAMMWSTSFEAKFFTIAYGLPLIFAHEFYLFPQFGIKFLELGPNWYKVGSVFEMIVFTYAIMFRAKRIKKELQFMKNQVLEYTIQLRSERKKLSEESVAMELIRRYDFTLKEIDILRDVAKQKTNKEIAKEHFISVNTVKTHIRNIFNKLEVNSKQMAGLRYKDHFPMK